MTPIRNSLRSSASFLILLYLTGAAVVKAEHVSQVADYRVLSMQEFAKAKNRLSSGLIQDFAGELTFDEKQSFVIRAKNGRQLSIIPARYESKDEDAAVTGHTTPRCGLYLITKLGNISFIRTVGYDWTETGACGRLDALGFAAKGIEMPRLLLIYSMFNVQDSYKEPLVMEWSDKQSLYVGNEKISVQLENIETAKTIAGIKQALLKFYHQTSNEKR